MTNMFENECGSMFNANSSFMTGRLLNISSNVTLNQTLNFSVCTDGGFRIPFDYIKGEECSPQAWG